MKRDKVYLTVGIVAVVLTLLVLLITLHPRRFKWDEIFTNNDEPWGYELFDDIMGSSLDVGYEVSEKDADSLIADSANLEKTLLLCGYILHTDTESTMNFVKEGGCLVIAVFDLSYEFEAAFNTQINNNRSYGIKPEKDNITSLKYIKDKAFQPATYYVSEELLTTIMETNTYSNNDNYPDYHLKWNHNLKKNNGEYVIRTATYGKGTIVLCSSPLIFTNYGILENNNKEIIARILSQCGKRPIIRCFLPYTQKEPDAWNSEPVEGLMDNILNDRSLSTAYFIALASLLLFLLFTARRKQRTIKVAEPRKNGQLEFIKQIGSMYFRKGEANSIVKSKFRLLREEHSEFFYILLLHFSHGKPLIILLQ